MPRNHDTHPNSLLCPTPPCPALPRLQVLVGYLVLLGHGRNGEVPRTADQLLERLLAAFPALQYKQGVLAALLQAVADEEEACKVREGGRKELVQAVNSCDSSVGPSSFSFTPATCGLRLCRTARPSSSSSWPLLGWAAFCSALPPRRQGPRRRRCRCRCG